MAQKLIYKEKKGNERIWHLFGLEFRQKRRKDINVAKLTESGICQTPRDQKIIVSVTSFSARINYVYKAVTSLLDQSFKPDMVILWLAEEEFPGKENDLPQNLLDLQKFGLTIKWCENLRSYKKLVPTLMHYPDDIIITVDDDIYYDKDMVKLLYESYLKEPQYIHCHRCTKIFYKNNEIKAKGGGKKYYKHPSFANKLVGVGGVLYPPHCLYKDITDIDLFRTLAPTNDDLWFWLMAVLNGVKIKVIDHNIAQPAELNETLGGPCLTNINDKGEKLFYKDLHNILNHYKGLEDKIKSDI